MSLHATAVLSSWAVLVACGIIAASLAVCFTRWMWR